METPASHTTPEGESITDIQNYLASFNKEIQDGGGGATVTEVVPAGAQVVVAEATGDGATVTGPEAAAGAPTETFFVTATASSFPEQFNGGTFYQTASHFFTAEGQNQQEFAAIVAAATGEEEQTTEAQGEQSANAEEANGLNQMVLSAPDGETEAETADGEATEISVTIPAALANQDGQRVMVTGGQHGTQQVVTVSGHPPSITAILGEAAKQSSPYGRAQTIRMVMQEAPSKEPTGDLAPGSTSGVTTVTTTATTATSTMSTTTSGGEEDDEDEGGTSEVREIAVNDDGTLQMMANLAEQAAHEAGQGGSAGEGGQVLLNSGNSYQTVTIVPSDSGPGEVSYVLIVSQPDDVKGSGGNKDTGMDMSVYDFNEGEQQQQQTADSESGGVTSSGAMGTGSGTGSAEGITTRAKSSSKMSKSTPKKSQTVSQAHMCNYCNYTSPKRYLLSRHMKSHSEERPHKCSVCERGFKTLASLQNHVNTHTGTRPHQCKECDSAFTTSGELVRHVRYKHTHEKPHRCTECDYASVELSKLKRHMRCHTGERPYQCPHCTYASPDTYKLKRHLRIHTGEKPYECDVCHARFTQSNSLKAHKLIHSAGNKPVFQCELCPTTCGRKTDLRIHVQKLHTSDKPLKCKRCGKSFPDRYTYKVHSKTHEGEKCFKCDLCPYASISQRHLESHTLIHTDQKPYRCDQCDQAFRQKQLLKRHKNLYHDPNYIPPTPKEKTHECGECGRAFRHKGNLIRHMAIHDPDASAQEKAEALRFGRIRRHRHDGFPHFEDDEDDEEEDEEEEEEDEEDDPDMSRENAALDGQLTTADGHPVDIHHNQVVVLEVIQLQGPEGEQQAVAVLSGEGMDMVTAEEAAEMEGCLVAAADMENARMAERDASDIRKMNNRRMSRPREAQVLATGSADGDVDLADAVKDDGHEQDRPRVNRGRKRRAHAEDGDDEAEGDMDSSVTSTTPKKRGKKLMAQLSAGGQATPRPRRSRKLPQLDEAELARREAEENKRRQQQKKKDVEECFGFKDEEADDGERSDAESAIQLLAAMQQSDQSQDG